MQHLRDTHDPVQRVPLVVNSNNDHYGSSDCTYEKFHNFPRSSGWIIREDYLLAIDPDVENPGTGIPQLGRFLQSWLFFGLIYTVVQDGNRPLLHYHDLINIDNGIVTTERLNGAIEKWQSSVKEQAIKDPDAAKIRMIRIEIVLQVARNVVQRNCACATFDDPPAYSSTPNDTNFVNDTVALSLMVLGETLTSAKAGIVDDCNLRVPGWHSDDGDEGWGPSRAVYKLIDGEEWCPRTTFILQNQLRSHATMMYGAYLAYRGSNRVSAHRLYNTNAPVEKRCTRNECMFKSEMLGSYTTAHIPRDHDHSQCQWHGPDMSQVLEIIGRGGVPLVTIERTDESEMELKVKGYTGEVGRDRLIYATISHVWSDGWGNEDMNELRTCQVKFLYDTLQYGAALSRGDDGSRPGTETIPFWMDTLVIPVLSNDKQKKKRILRQTRRTEAEWLDFKRRAIGQIHEVFTQSQFTIVIDNDLSSMSPSPDRPCESAMRILASGWMKRLWTLQEAFLSKRLFIAFNDEGAEESKPVKDFDDMMHGNLSGASGVVSATRKHISESLMNGDRTFRLRQKEGRSVDAYSSDGFSLIANAWRAARWRTTSNAAHEALALATLLDLQYQGTRIDEDGLRKIPKKTTEHDKKKILDSLICKFWELFNETYPGSVPPGLIFLPGERVKTQGFGWAPQTFMSVVGTDYPDPLDRPQDISRFMGTTIHKEWGLQVRYPGFILHCQHGAAIRNKILFTDHTGDFTQQSLLFPSNSSFLEWYRVRPADSKPSTDELPRIIGRRRTQLAIILVRPEPKEALEEIGLLVEIYKTVKTYNTIQRRQNQPPGLSRQGSSLGSPPTVTGQHNQNVQQQTATGKPAFCCQIIRRVHIKRDTSQILLNGRSDVGGLGSSDSDPPSLLRLMPPNMKPAQIDVDRDDTCIGEALGADQEWYVDGYQDSRNEQLEESRRARKAPRAGIIAKIVGIGRPNQSAPSPDLPRSGDRSGDRRSLERTNSGFPPPSRTNTRLSWW